MRKRLLKILFMLCILAFEVVAFSNSLTEKAVALDPEDDKQLLQAKTKSEICKVLNYNIASYAGLNYLVKDCKLHLVKNPELLNDFIMKNKGKAFNLTKSIYADLVIDFPYDEISYHKDFSVGINTEEVCDDFEGKVVSSNNFNYFLIENCKKRPFKKQSDIVKSFKELHPIYAIDKYYLDLIPTGKAILVEPSTWKPKTKETDLLKDRKKYPVESLCKGLNKHVFSFHGNFYFVENCSLRFIFDDLSIVVQEKANENHFIKELSIEQRLFLPKGSKISSDQVFKKMD